MFLVSDAKTGQHRFFVEAKNELQALTRSWSVAQFTNMPEEVLLTFEESKESLPLPHFMEGYFSILKEIGSEEN
ncbi:MAG: hypothetical protein C4516_09020 [Oxalobacter sp.]|nr:MAG: hypothetical protein C4516_09020 [Oxalobacter sp.]